MGENDEQRRALIHEYYQIYRALQKRHSLREHSHFDIYGNNLIEIWEYEGERKGRCICKVKEDTEIACYQRAIKMMESYSGKETVRHEKLEIPCSYQGSKQRLAKDIADYFFEENKMDTNTRFYELCCGTGAVSLELINRGFDPDKVEMIDIGMFGAFWQAVGNGKFDMEILKKEMGKLPSKENIQLYLKKMSKEPIEQNLSVYHFLIFQAASFGAKQVYAENGKWRIQGLRNYWTPTEKSNRRSPVNPMMPMPETIVKRVGKIVYQLAGRITALQEDVFKAVERINKDKSSEIVIYCDPPYTGRTGYSTSFDTYKLINLLRKDATIYISEGYEMKGAKKSKLLSKGRRKGNISGKMQRNRTEEWINKY